MTPPPSIELHPAQKAATPDTTPIELSNANELQLTKRLMSFDSSHPEGIRACTDFAVGWLEGHNIHPRIIDLDGLPIIDATVGDGPITVVFHAHLDVVPGRKEQFMPLIDDTFIWGRGSYDMKGATAAMFAALADLAAENERHPLGLRIRLVVVPDEEDDQPKEIRASEYAAQNGLVGDFVICGEPTDLHVGIQAKGVLNVRLEVDGRAAHSATPWLGVNAIERAMDIFDRLKMLPFAKESSRFYERPSINLGRIFGGDRINQVPDRCTLDVDIRYLPEQPIERVREEISSLAVSGCRVTETFYRPPAKVSTKNPFLKCLQQSTQRMVGERQEVRLVGRDGTNDGTYFLQRGIPSVEFGPIGGGHHGPKEKTDIASLRTYRLALLDFIQNLRKDPASYAGLVSHVNPDSTSVDESRSLL